MRISPIALTLAAPALLASQSVSRKWTLQHLDPWGYVPISRAKVATDTKAAITSAEKDPKRAYSALAVLYAKRPADMTNTYCMLVVAKRAGTLIEATERISKRLAVLGGTRRTKGPLPKECVVPLAVAYAMLFPGEPGQSYDVSDLRTATRFWYGDTFEAGLDPALLEPSECVLFAAAKLALGQLGLARRTLEATLHENDQDARVHLLLCRAYGAGIVQRTRGNPPVPVPIPAEERVQEELALKCALAAAKLEPAWAEPHYYVGKYSAKTNPKRARASLRKYLELADQVGPERKKWIHDYLKAP